MKIPENYEMVSFDVKSFFTSVSLEHTIDIIITQICEKHEITTVFTKNEMKKLLTICMKNLHFSFNNDIYIQVDGIATGWPLVPVIVKIFMIEPASVLVPKLNDHVKKWRRFVDGTFVHVKCGSIKYVLSILNSFHDNIRSTYEQENKNRLAFSRCFFTRDHEKVNTTVFGKDTHNDLYLHWESFSSISWRCKTLKWLISRAYIICSNQILPEKKLEHLKNTFHKKNRYPLWMINQVMETVKESINTEYILTNQLYQVSDKRSN